MGMAANRNKQAMTYALPNEQHEVFKTDEDGHIIFFEDSEGNRYAESAGEYEQLYYDPVEFRANINGKLSEVTLQAFGIDNSANYCELITGKVRSTGKPIFPLEIGAVIWRASDIEYKNIWDKEKKQEKGVVDGGSADYVVRGVVPESLNEVRYLLKRLKVAEE